MTVLNFQLSAFSKVPSIAIRELNGHDEHAVYDAGTACVLQLLNNLIIQQPGIDEQKIKAEKISITDRDHILAGLYKHTYGSAIESSPDCRSCGEKYDVKFFVDDLVKHTDSRKKNIRIDNEGFFCSENGIRFRLPDGEDELAVWGMNTEKAEQILFSRCLAQPVTENNQQVMELMEEMGPLLTTDIKINCPECGYSQVLQFDMQQFLLTRIKNERKKLATEVHNIALSYGWSHKEILDLPRTERKMYTGLINQH